MTWAQLPVLVTIGVLMLSVALLAMDERNRRKFATRDSVCTPDGKTKFPYRDELTGMAHRMDEQLAELNRKVERNTGLFVAIDDRTGDLEGKVMLLEERQTQQWSRISEQMAQTAATIKEVANEMKEVSHRQQEFALLLERIHNSSRRDQ